MIWDSSTKIGPWGDVLRTLCAGWVCDIARSNKISLKFVVFNTTGGISSILGAFLFFSFLKTAFSSSLVEDPFLIGSSQQTIVGLQDVLKTSSTHLQRNNISPSKASWRCLAKTSLGRLEGVLKTCRKSSWKRLEDILKTSWKTKNCYAEDVLKTCLEDVLKTCFENIFKTSWRQKKNKNGDICISHPI